MYGDGLLRLMMMMWKNMLC